MRILAGLPSHRSPWQARLLAVALGLLGPVVLALSIRVPQASPREDARDSTERVVALDLPALGQRVDDERVPPLASSGIVPPASPARERATPGAAATPGFPAFPSFPSRDSSGSGEPAASTHVPGARELLPSPAAGRALCLPPACGGTGTSVAAGAAGGAGVGIVFAPMSREERDSIARAVITAAAAAGGSESHPASTLPPGTAGVSLPVGLPGGGPTRAQRERARVLDADVASRLARIRARADSIVAARRRDSVARVMPRTDDRIVAPDA
jgi:hypothetical protein